MKQTFKNILSDLASAILKIVFLLIIYQIFRIIFFVYNRSQFPDVEISDLIRMMKGGLRFDLTGILYLNLIFLFLYLIPLKSRKNKYYKKFLFWLFIILNSIGFLMNTGDIFYFGYVLKRSTADVFMFAGESNIGLLVIQFIKDFWWGVLLWVFFIYLLIKWYSFTEKITTDFKQTNWTFYPYSLLILLIVLYFSIVAIRGGFTRTTRPINLNNAAAYTNKPLEMAIVLNTPFTILRTFGKKGFKKVRYFDDNEVEKIYTPVKHFQDTIPLQKKNIVIIIVESLAKEYTGFFNKDIKNYKGYTPFLDSLAGVSHSFVNAHANGRKSIDAIPSVLTSIPSLIQPFVLSPYATDDINGLGKLLKEKGYKTAFFHGAPNGSMGFDAITKMAGFDEYYGMNEYGKPDEFDGYWGIPDNKFLSFMTKQLDTFKQPFIASVFTLSSHHPFKLPKGFENKFKEGKLPIHKVIQYTDFSLKNFFKKASQSSWYYNTIFVITADHCNQTYLQEYNSLKGRYNIPLIIFEPGNTKNIKIDSTLTQQIDIMPRLLRQIHYSGDFVSFGNDPQSEKKPFVINYNNNTWQFYQGDYLLLFQEMPEKIIALYNYKNDKLLKQNIKENHRQIIDSMLPTLKAFIQQYKNRLLENRLTITDKS